MAHRRDELETALYEVVLENLGKLRSYVPGPVKKAGGEKKDLLRAYSADPMFSIFGLDSPEYIAAALSGGTVTSIHRKLGDIYEAIVKIIFQHQLGISMDDLTYRAKIMSGTTAETRTADVYLHFHKIADQERRRTAEEFAHAEIAKLASEPKIELIGIGMEIRHCYQTNDSKRTQADEAMARHLLVAGVLPLMPLFCNQSAPTIIKRYRSVWVVKVGYESYDLVRVLSGFDLYDFMKRNREDFRKPVIEMLRGLTS